MTSEQAQMKSLETQVVACLSEEDSSSLDVDSCLAADTEDDENGDAFDDYGLVIQA